MKIRFSEKIEVVNEYKYLGINLTCHLQTKLESAISAINANWLDYMYNPKIKLFNKFKIFDTAAKSIMFYGAQVWGLESNETVEKLFRFFIKKILFLPNNTPNFMLLLGTGYHSQYIETLKLHCGYIAKILNLCNSRLALETKSKTISWIHMWCQLCEDFRVQFNFNASRYLRTLIAN